MSNSTPRISVILPTYNRRNTLSKSIDSVLNQTYGNFELIVVDDGSTDDTTELVKSYTDARICYIKHQKNLGAPAARNTGIQSAEGDLIAFQDSDDIWLSEKLEKQVKKFEDSDEGVGVVYTGMQRKIDGEYRYLPYPSIRSKDGDIRESIFYQNFISTQVAMVCSTCFNRVGKFDEDCPGLSDWELWIRISDYFDFELIDEPLVESSIMQDSISKDNRLLVESRERIVKKHKSKFNKRALAKQYFYIGHGSMKIGDKGKGRKYLKKSFWTNPNLIAISALIVSYFGPKFYQSIYENFNIISGRESSSRF